MDQDLKEIVKELIYSGCLKCDCQNRLPYMIEEEEKMILKIKNGTTLFAFLCVSPLWRGSKEKQYVYECGQYNGYVGFSKEIFNPIENLAEEECFDVHGGISFDGNFGPEKEIIPLSEIPFEWWNKEKYRIIGFNCAHGYDTESDWPFGEVKEETERLMSQVKALIDEQL